MGGRPVRGVCPGRWVGRDSGRAGLGCNAPRYKGSGRSGAAGQGERAEPSRVQPAPSGLRRPPQPGCGRSSPRGRPSAEPGKARPAGRPRVPATGSAAGARPAACRPAGRLGPGRRVPGEGRCSRCLVQPPAEFILCLDEGSVPDKEQAHKLCALARPARSIPQVYFGDSEVSHRLSAAPRV